MMGAFAGFLSARRLPLLALAVALAALPAADSAHARDGSAAVISTGPTITSSPAGGDSYGNGEVIAVSVTFSEAVTVVGEPRVRISIGERKRWARYSGGSGSTTLTFTYTVKGNDRDDDGISIGKNALKLKGGSIADGEGNAASIAHPALADQAGHKVNRPTDESAPRRAGAGTHTHTPTPEPPPPANSEPQFDDGDSATRSVDEDAATGSNVGAAVSATDADNDTLTYALTGSNSFTINGSSGQITIQSGLDYETQASYALTVTVSDGRNASGEADASVDDTIAVTVSVGNVDEAGEVSLDSSEPQAGSPVSASLSDPDGGVSGETWSWAGSANGTDWTAIAGANARTYTPSADDAGKYLQATVSYSDAQGSGKSASAATASAVIVADRQRQRQPAEPEPPQVTAGPVITSSPASGDAYGKGEAIFVAVTFNEAVTVEGQPRIRLTIGERKRWARYSGANGATLTFAYKVKGSDRDGDGISIGANQLKLNGGSIADGDGNAAVPTHPALADQAGHSVDGSRKPSPADSEPVVDEAGVVFLEYETDPPEVGGKLRAVLLDPDGVVGDVAWTWQRSADATTWETIAGATGALFTTTEDDAGRYLRATANYADGHGPGKTAQYALAEPVAAIITPHQDPEAQTTAPVPQTVPADWAYIPAGLKPGDTFRLLFITSTTLMPTSGNIADYNTHVQNAANNNTTLRPFKSQFRAVGATNSTSAPDNTATTHTTAEKGLPIYWLGGAKVADDYADFYDASWDSTSGKYENGNAVPSPGHFWSGATNSGVNAGYYALGGSQSSTARGSVAQGKLNIDNFSNTNSLPLLAISPVIMLQEAPAKPAGFIATPGNGKVELAWTDPSDSSITKYQYRQKEGAGAYGAWTDISGSGKTTTAHTVTGLKNGTSYGFRIRAVNAAGGGAPSDEATATPQVNIIWSATLTVDHKGAFFGCENDSDTRDACSSSIVLTDDDFTYEGTTYTVHYLYWTNQDNHLILTFSNTGLTSQRLKSDLNLLTLHADGEEFAIKDAAARAFYIEWSFDPNPDWTDGQKVSLRLTRPFTAAELDYRVTEVTCDAPGNKGTRCYVPYNWSAIPRDADGEPLVPPGKSFRLMFITSTGSNANAATVGPYNNFVQGKANGVGVLKPLKDHFRALLSGSDSSAVANTKTGSGDLGRNSPIYWTNGDKVADGYADLYDGSWDHNSVTGDWPSNERGTDRTITLWVWTGSKPDGTTHTGYRMGDTNVMIGFPNSSGKELGGASAATTGTGRNAYGKTSILRFYGISPVLTVGQPPPDSTEEPVWSATLTVDEDDNYYGCSNSISDMDNCSERRVLEYDDYFTYEGVTHTIDSIFWQSEYDLLDLRFADPDMELELDPRQAKAALSSLTLNVMDADGHTLAGSEFKIQGASLQRSFDPRVDWTDGQKVFLSLTVNGRQPAPPALTGLRAVSQDGAVWLTWDEVDNVEVPTGKQQVRYRPRVSRSWGAWTSWKDVNWFSREGYELVGLASTTVYGLTNGTRYQFEVRPVNAGGKGPAARVEATPKAKPAAPTGLVANSADKSVILHWDYGNNDDITKYQYRWRLAGADGGDWQPVPQGEFHPSDLTAHTVSGLPSGFKIDFQVRARSNNGWSRPSAASNAVTPEAPPAPPQAVTVPHDWAGIPTEADGTTPAVKPGESFRLLFVTSAKTAATATNISHYNTFVQELANKNDAFKSFKDQFRAVISTAAVSARENIGADLDGNTVPVYWAATRGSDGNGRIGSQLVVGPSQDLFEDRWADIEDVSPYYETGGQLTLDADEPYLVWTGSLWDGSSWRQPYHNPWFRYYAGAAGVMAGNLNSEKAQISYYDPARQATEHPVNTTELPLYGISPVITVEEPPSQ